MGRPKLERGTCQWRGGCKRLEYVVKAHLCRAHYERERRGSPWPNSPVRERGGEPMHRIGPISIPRKTKMALQRIRGQWGIDDTAIVRALLVEILQRPVLLQELLEAAFRGTPSSA